MPVSSLGQTSPLYKRLRILGEQEEIVISISPSDELADADGIFKIPINNYS